ncbi:SET domain-containing protein 4 isoform X2 [Alexandromys fortis]|uniref:SET domain-containing protein 4 isoform X2 n=1 Tax=Alexandromys fortis TaxID=100897 RepID=UPI002153197D|nr:SET domain-containing protein 4 isoform X2 [Microtus fortis]
MVCPGPDGSQVSQPGAGLQVCIWWWWGRAGELRVRSRGAGSRPAAASSTAECAICVSTPATRGSPVNESHRPEFIELKRWLKDRKFEDTGLVPACFPGTGRGLMSRTSLQEGEMIISLPESCLLTTDTVIRSSLGPYIKKWKPPPSPLLALCTFLVSEKHLGDQSLWKSYLDILPSSYTCPVCWEPEVVDLLPEPLRTKAEEQRAHVQDLFASSRAFFASLQPLFAESVDSIFSYSAFLWAWCTVNTRAVYLRSTRQDSLSAEPDTCALAPYLDLLNHSPHVQVKAAFNEKTGCYEIRTASRCRKHEEVFICYGPHDNQRLLLEYGFVSTCNPHACVPVPGETLVKYLPAADKQVHRKMSILKERGFTENLTFGWDGPSWRLLTALKLLCLEAEKFTSWKKVLLGEVISDANEKTSLGVARKICSDFIEETRAVLRKIIMRIRSEHSFQKEIKFLCQEKSHLYQRTGKCIST